jgi:hypothetical protein
MDWIAVAYYTGNWQTLVNAVWSFGCRKCGEFFLDGDILAYQEGLCFVKLVTHSLKYTQPFRIPQTVCPMQLPRSRKNETP